MIVLTFNIVIRNDWRFLYRKNVLFNHFMSLASEAFAAALTLFLALGVGDLVFISAFVPFFVVVDSVSERALVAIVS